MSFKYFIISLINRSTFLFQLFYKNRKRYKKLVFSNKTGLVIEGFPRCANTFSVIAFQQSQLKKVCIAHHLHAIGQIKLAIQKKVPVLILIREPEEAISSLLARHPEIAPRQAINEYVRFYNYILSVSDSVIIADFKLITTYYDLVIKRLNKKFEENFCLYINNNNNDKLVFEEIDSLNRKSEQGSVRQLARPSEDKKSINNDFRKKVCAEGTFNKALKVYSCIVENSNYIE